MASDREICDDPSCNCRNVEPNFRAWYHANISNLATGKMTFYKGGDRLMKFTKYIQPTQEQIEHVDAVDKLALGLDAVFDVVNCDPRYRALAKTSLEQAIMWINKGIYTHKESEND